MKNRHLIKRIAGLVCTLSVLCAGLYIGLRFLESNVLYPEQQTVPAAASKTIYRDDVAYFPRQDITTLMILGIDQFGPAVSSESYNNRGDADMVALLVMDETAKEVTVLSLNRDTMVEMPILGLGGKQTGTAIQQLALAHTYGNGLQESCENTRQVVSDLLYGIPIEYYVSLRMDAITILNDAVGGVTVNVDQDFSAVDGSIPMGEVTLHGDQAIHFVRSRKDVGNQLNLSRLDRQKSYMKGFVDAFQKKMQEDGNFALKTYDTVSEYAVSDCPVNVLSKMLQEYQDYTLKEVVSPEGRNVLGDVHYEFYLDEKKLDDLVISLFYAPKQ